MITYSKFFRMYGVRKPELLATPPLPSITKLVFPVQSIYHHIGQGIGDIGPSQNDPMIAAQPSLSAIEHVDHLDKTDGDPRKLAISFDSLVRKHRVVNKKFVPLKKIELVARNEKTLIAFNYSLLDLIYRYPRVKLAQRLKNQNKLITIVDKINEITKTISHHHYLMVDLPEFLPSIAELRESLRNNPSEESLARFSNFNLYMIQSLWVWVGATRQESILSQLSDESARLTNVIFRDAGRFCLINLGELDSWRKKEKIEQVDDSDGASKSAVSIQKSFLSMLVNMTNARSEMMPENISEDDGGEQQQPEEENDQQTEIQETIHEKIDRDLSTLDVLGSDIQIDDEITDDIVEEPLTDLNIRKNNRPPSFIKRISKDNQLATDRLGDNFLDVLNEIADTGSLGAGEYRRLSEQAHRYSSINIDGIPLDKYASIDPEETQIKEVAKVPQVGQVFDKSMLQSTLLDFTNRYVDKFLQRDIAGSVLSLQNAGILIKDYKVEEINNVTGSYNAYSVEIKPIQGQPSVLRFKIPKVDEQGQFIVNNTKYYLRMQRGDLPIRKVSDSRVALTSYYGKIFVDRCSRKVHNFGRWLSDQIRAIGLDDTDNRVINLVSGSVFYHDLQLPRIYSTLAKSFIEVSIKQAAQEQTQPEYIRFYFDYAKRHKVLNLPTDNNIEIDGKLVCGVHSDGSYVVVDDAGIYKVSYSQITGYTYQELPSIQSMLGLEDKNIPIDFAEVMVFGVHVPVGIVLGYYLGLSNLVKSLTEPRIVPTGKRVNLQPNEWAMYFEDETWVFDASNKLASMILAGWRDYTRATIQYPAHEFDRKDVYLNILESKQYNSRYTREMDLMKQMFIDPITYRLLVKLKEPTTWVGLLKRSCELLLTDQHPAETDPRYTRIKGYERFAGIVYRELINGLRIHNSKGNKTRYKLDHNPYAVWAAITQDSSKEQVCETNPIQDLKEKEAVTYTGTGGRTARTMSKRTRVYHASELGTISESTVDSSDVGVNIFTSANPQFNCLEGLSDPFEPGKTGAASILSTSALASFGSDHDDCFF